MTPPFRKSSTSSGQTIKQLICRINTSSKSKTISLELAGEAKTLGEYYVAYIGREG